MKKPALLDAPSCIADSRPQLTACFICFANFAATRAVILIAGALRRRDGDERKRVQMSVLHRRGAADRCLSIKTRNLRMPPRPW